MSAKGDDFDGKFEGYYKDAPPQAIVPTLKGQQARVLAEDLEGKTIQLTKFSSACEGRKFWANGYYTFEATQYNLGLFAMYFGGKPLKAPLAPLPAPAPLSPGKKRPRPKGSFFKTEPFPLQERAFIAGRRKEVFAYFMEMGTGKTKVTIDEAADAYCEGLIDQVLIFAPKGVHSQWTDSKNEPSQVEIHCPVPFDQACWGKKFQLPKRTPAKLQFVAFNYDALLSEAPFNMMLEYVSRAPTMIVADESHKLKNASTKRSKAIRQLAPYSRMRRLLTGTPIAKNLVDLWGQFKFLDESIIGHKYMTTFRAEYCIMGGFEGREVVGFKNTERLLQKINPHVYRAKKDELGLPPKLFGRRVFDLSVVQQKHYDAMKKNFITQFSDGTDITVANAAVMLLRLQQIACGYLAHEGKLERIEDARLPQLLEIAEQREGKMVVWCRFIEDIIKIEEALGAQCVTYYGARTKEERDYAKTLFTGKGGPRFFIANPQAGGTGLDGLQKVARTVVYYSNSFSSLDRWQSEDRTNRIGMTGDCFYIDLIARGTIDLRLMQTLRKKAELKDVVMDITQTMSVKELREIIES